MSEAPGSSLNAGGLTVLNYQQPEETRAGVWSTLGWAVYLGMSWTWCIGMFLPVLLVRDYGVWGWVVFAVPNVVGAAAMGWLLSHNGSYEILRQHRLAVEGFSVITIAFQLFFLVWLLGWTSRGNAVAFSVVALLVVLLALWRTHWRILAAAVWIASTVFILHPPDQLSVIHFSRSSG